MCLPRRVLKLRQPTFGSCLLSFHSPFISLDCFIYAMPYLLLLAATLVVLNATVKRLVHKKKKTWKII